MANFSEPQNLRVKDHWGYVGLGESGKTSGKEWRIHFRTESAESVAPAWGTLSRFLDD